MRLAEAILDSWDRNNAILVNLLGAIPADAMDLRAMEGGPTIGELFAHMSYVRLAFVYEDIPGFVAEEPCEEWVAGLAPARMEAMLRESARTVREAVAHALETDAGTRMHYDHPILLLQQMIWHEGYHHGQIKLALKLAGRPLADDAIGPVTWSLWMDKRQR